MSNTKRRIFVFVVFVFVGDVVFGCYRGIEKRTLTVTITSGSPSGSTTGTTGDGGSYLASFLFEANSRFLDFVKVLGGLLNSRRVKEGRRNSPLRPVP